MDWTGIDLGLYGAWNVLGSRSPLRRFVRSQEIDNDRAAALYRKAKVGLSLFRQSVGFGKGTPKVTTAESLNPRLLELAACGVPLVSEWRPEVEEVFGATVPTFRTGDHRGATAALRGLLADDGARKDAAEQLPRLVAGRDFDGMARTVARDLMKADADGERWRPLEERFGAVAG
jgi:glycosyltransferase involved in cell wall biosynthesis